jgi:hypothetical protein
MDVTIVMMVGKKTEMIPEPLPLKLEREIGHRAGVADRTGPQQETMLAFGLHYLISVLFGAVYGLLRWATQFSPLPSGPLYGLGTYLVNLVGIGPALDLTRGPQDEKPVTVGRRAMMHTVYGTVTAFVSDKVRQRLYA